MRKGALIVALVTSAILLAVTMFVISRHERLQAAWNSERGSVSQGTRFGVEVGAPVRMAAVLLERQGFIQQRRPVAECGGRRLAEGERIVRYRDPFRTFVSGNVCLFVSDGTVRAIGWQYGYAGP